MTMEQFSLRSTVWGKEPFGDEVGFNHETLIQMFVL